MISCLHPNIIINPGVYEAVAFSHKLIFDGRTEYCNGCSRLFRRKAFNILKNQLEHITQDNLENYYTYDRFNNKIFCYLAVPCRKCILCQQSDENDICQRLMFEAESHSCEPYFITLTFGRWSLPKDNNPTIRHIQTFIKRLRNYCDSEIKFYAQGEHGKKKGRAHLHVLIFGLPDMPHFKAVEFFSKAWLTNKFYTRCYKGHLIKKRLPIGNVYVSQINDPNYVSWYEQTKNRKLHPADGLRYCCKYSSKHSHCRSWSKGLGKDFAKKFTKEMHQMSKCSVITSDWSLIYRTKYGTKQQVIMTRWFLHTVFKPFNRATYYYRKRLYDHIAFIVATRVDYYSVLSTLPLDFVGLGLAGGIFDKRYISKIFSNAREKKLFKGRAEYLKFLRYCASNKFVPHIFDLPIEQLKEETFCYNNFCKLYFSNKPELTIGMLQARAYKRQSYINKSQLISTL